MTAAIRFPVEGPDRRQPELQVFRLLSEDIQRLEDKLEHFDQRFAERLRALDTLTAKVDRNERDIQRLWKARSAKEAKDGGFSVSAGFVKAMAAIGAAVVGAIMYLIDKAKP